MGDYRIVFRRRRRTERYAVGLPLEQRGAPRHDHCRYFILKLIITGVFVLVPPMLVPVFIQVWTCSGVLGLCFGVSMVRVILDAMLNSRLRGLSIEKEAACAELAPGRARARLACGERGNASASEGGAAAAEEEGKNKREAV